MKNVVIIGAGAHSAEIAGLIHDNNKYINKESQLKIKGYIDDNDENYRRYKFNEPLLSNLSDYIPEKDDYFLIGVSNIKARKACLEKLSNKNLKFTNFIHHTAIVYETAQIGEGNVICCFAKIGPNAIIGDLNSINSKTEIGHDCIVGSNNVFAGNIGIAGYSVVKNDNFFGMNSGVIPDISIGSENTIQAGMIVDKNIGDQTYIFHRFKEKVIAIPK
ncbi:acetyltransferase [Marinifilum fragile]|uniref:acetyltransferase n=1 Tax=Marinifilum fragile TaxID=570161 RepID=UPI0006D095D9|nr:acetyltransferase [Marinifilum fragile]